MPQSLVLNLTTQSSLSPKHLQGYSLQQLFFNLVDVVDPELGHVLRRDKKNRSYSLSALQVKPPAVSRSANGSPIPLRIVKQQRASAFSALQYTHSQSIAANTHCWWRVSFLDDDLFDHLIFLWNQLKDEIFQLGTTGIKITKIAADLPGISWASSCSYRDLYEQACAHQRDIHLQFVTPTAFELDGNVTPLPTADAIFQPLRKYWNRYSGLVFAPSLIDSIAPTSFDIKTEPVQSTLRSSFQTITGCTGAMSFRIGSDDPLTTKRINALANFTQYCGVGSNTRFGMGVLRRIDAAAKLSLQQKPANATRSIRSEIH
ncbi:MAG: CRISPR-associated endoribonuclease Cas6 [Cyanobacteria bacterium J06649_4]